MSRFPLTLLTAMAVLTSFAGAANAQYAYVVEGVPSNYCPHCYPVLVDGVYGPQTAWAVRVFQRVNGIGMTGQAGPVTLRALRLPQGRVMRQGMRGADVSRLQHALNRMTVHILPAPEPVAMPLAPRSPKTPIVTRTPPPIWVQEPPPPMPYATPLPVATPTPQPWVEPSVELTPEPIASDRPTLQLYGGDWFLPLTAGLNDFDFAFQRPAFYGGLKLWLGDWGIGGEYVQMPNLFLGTTAVIGAGGMYDAQVSWRDPWAINHLSLGYRGFTGANLGTLAYGLDLPLGVDWLRARGSILGGSDFGSGWLADGRLGLGLVLGPVFIDAGYRYLTVNGVGVAGGVDISAPFLDVGLQF